MSMKPYIHTSSLVYDIALLSVQENSKVASRLFQNYILQHELITLPVLLSVTEALMLLE